MSNADQLDPRLNAWRADLADARLEGRVPSTRFVVGSGRRVVAPLARTLATAHAAEPRSSAGGECRVRVVLDANP